MHQKYFDVLEYFRESRMSPECNQTVQEFQMFDSTYQEMTYYLYTLEKLDNDVQKELPSNIQQALEDPFIKKQYKAIRERMAHERFI